MTSSAIEMNNSMPGLFHKSFKEFEDAAALSKTDDEGGTYSFVAGPIDARCQWWCRIGTPAAVRACDPAAVESASDLPGTYLRKGTDLELPAWTAIFDGEANHATKNRGWTHQVGIVVPMPGNGLTLKWFHPSQEAKKAIKAFGMHEIMGGSGPNAAMVRAARFVVSGTTTDDRLARARAIGLVKA